MIAIEPLTYPDNVTDKYAVYKAAQRLFSDAYAAAETVLGRPLEAGDLSPCCADEQMMQHPNGVELWCPCCGHLHTPRREVQV